MSHTEKEGARLEAPEAVLRGALPAEGPPAAFNPPRDPVLVILYLSL